jgi:hypothetical protein
VTEAGVFGGGMRKLSANGLLGYPALHKCFANELNNYQTDFDPQFKALLATELTYCYFD